MCKAFKQSRSMRRRTTGMVDVSVQGIPCYAECETFTDVKPWAGSAHTCPSADDYYGYTEVEFTLYDRKGYRAEWLERKMDGDDIEAIESAIIADQRDSEDWDR